MKSASLKNLLIDADDTLWENNIYFERVINAVVHMLEPFSVDPAAFRACLNETERRHIPNYGYGTRNFTRSLLIAFEQCSPPEVNAALKPAVHDLGMSIVNQPLEILDGVPETLEYLGDRHRLYLVTKGNAAEQSRKIAESGLRPHFQDVAIVTEKTDAVYRELSEIHGWDPARTWMIGNSPRSDINPALSAGLHAVYIPRFPTWVLEHEEPEKHPRLIELEKFSDLRSCF